MNKQDIYDKLVDVLVEDFEVERDEVTGDSNLYTELDLDSIDAVDLVVKLQQIVGKKIKPESFRQVRTIQDVVDELDKLLN